MASKFTLESLLTMTDRITGPMRKATSNVVGFSRKMTRSFERVNSVIDRTTRKMKKFAKTAAIAGVAVLALGVGTVAREYVKFDDAIYGATARFKDAQVEGANVTQIMDNLRKSARQTGADTQFSAAEAAQGLDKYARAGFTSSEAINSLRSVIDLTTVSGEEFARVADISSDLLGSFGYSALESTAKIAKLKDLNNTLAIAVNSSNVTLEDLFETLKDIGPISKIAGADMKEVVAMASMLGGAGIKGSTGATAIKNAYLRLGEMGPKIQQGLAAAGLGMNDIKDKAGNMRSLPGILEKVVKGVEGMGTHDQLKIMSLIFGKRAIAGAKNIGELSTQITLLNDKMRKNTDASAIAADKMRESWGIRLKMLQSTLIEKGMQIFDQFDGKGRKGISGLTQAIKGFDMSPIVATLKILLWTFQTLAPVIPYVVGGFIAFKVALYGLLGVQQLIIGIGWIKYLWMMRAAIMQAALATKVWAAVQWVLNGAISFLLSPIFLVIAGIAAFAALAYLVYENWAPIKEFFGGLWDGICEGFGIAISWITEKFTAVVDWVAQKWQTVKEFFGFAAESGDAAMNATVNNNVQTPAHYRSPETAHSSHTVNNRSQVDVNFNNTPAGTTVQRKGGTAAGGTLNLGVNPA